MIFFIRYLVIVGGGVDEKAAKFGLHTYFVIVLVCFGESIVEVWLGVSNFLGHQTNVVCGFAILGSLGYLIIFGEVFDTS